ncbi:MFS transporter [Arthrobacter nitrophenolicus]|uniref:MFS transporter n=1 Tax=Arthrobacter nitrophenolicus TaxID=683150 RepID=UPI0014049A53
MTPASVTLALRPGAIDPTNKAALLSLVAGLGAACALFANPIFGRLSDRSTSRFGQRRSFILGGSATGILGTLLISFAPFGSGCCRWWCVARVAFKAALAATGAVLPERIPTRLRGCVSAFF